MTGSWRADLLASANRSGIGGFVIAWIMNPGFVVATLYRIARWGRRRGGLAGKLVEVLAWRRIVRGYGCYIDPGAEIGPGLRLPHPVGIVIGAGTVIGAGATIYHGVTFGRAHAGGNAYPRLGDSVTVYTGATLIGAIDVGENAIIAAGALVRDHVPAGAIAAGSPAALVGQQARGR